MLEFRPARHCPHHWSRLEGDILLRRIGEGRLVEGTREERLPDNSRRTHARRAEKPQGPPGLPSSDSRPGSPWGTGSYWTVTTTRRSGTNGGDDGLYDALALVNGAPLVDSFTLTFVWFGAGGAGGLVPPKRRPATKSIRPPLARPRRWLRPHRRARPQAGPGECLLELPYDRLVGSCRVGVSLEADGEVEEADAVPAPGAARLAEARLLERPPVGEQYVGVDEGHLDGEREG